MNPEWDSSGVLPPIKPGTQGHSTERSPYLVSMQDLMNSFSFSEKRRNILRGLINYRQALYQVGITQGFQWINGSFTENIELLEDRDPNDIDVVTFCYLPDGMQQDEILKKVALLFDPMQTKQSYHVDGYVFWLGQPLESRHVRQISYWAGMWSHRRNRIWKGFLQVSLSKSEDELACRILDLRCAHGS